MYEGNRVDKTLTDFANFHVTATMYNIFLSQVIFDINIDHKSSVFNKYIYYYYVYRLYMKEYIYSRKYIYIHTQLIAKS